MPSASQRGNLASRSLGGASTSSNETPVASKENPDPAAREDGNTPATRPGAQCGGAEGPSTSAGAGPADHTEATGRDHPSQDEHKPYEKFRGSPSDPEVRKPDGTKRPGED